MSVGPRGARPDCSFHLGPEVVKLLPGLRAAKLSAGATWGSSRKQCSGAVFRRGETPRFTRHDTGTFPKMLELGNVPAPVWRPAPSTQAPVASSITDRWHLVTASLGLGLFRGSRATCLALFLLSRRPSPRLVEPVLEHVLRVTRRPAVRQQRHQVRLPGAQPQRARSSAEGPGRSGDVDSADRDVRSTE